jgi:hypothetical protein
MSRNSNAPRYVAFQRGKRVAEGSEAEIATQLASLSMTPYAYGAYDSGADHRAQALVFDVATGERIELLPEAAETTVDTDKPAAPPVGPGRPKLGVVAREVTLLPHDWEWLGQQPGGASVTLRKLVLKARRMSASADRVRQTQIICYRFITGIAGHEPGYEEATRALFTGNREHFAASTDAWPADVRDHARGLAEAAFSASDAALLKNSTDPASTGSSSDGDTA